MIGEVLPRGRSVRGLLYYLFTEGQAGEKGLESDHRDARVVASWDGLPQQLQPPVCAGGGRDFTGLVSRLNEPLALLGFSKDELKRVKPVYHLTIAAAKDPQTGALVDPYLSDAQWADIAAEYMDRLGLARRGDNSGVRWVAVRHADDHVHVVATLARQDGRRAHPSNDYYRAREASLIVEGRYGLRGTSPATGAGRADATRAETRKHQATAHRRSTAGLPGPTAPDREVLRRQVRVAAAGAHSLEEFLGRLRADGLLVRERFSTRDAGQVTGYAVALPDRYDSGGQPIYFGGGKLAPDLSVPRLQRRWQQVPGTASSDTHTDEKRRSRIGAVGHAESGEHASRTDRFGLTPEERLRIWHQAADAAAVASEQITATANSDPRAAADAAWAASDFLAAAGRVVEGRRGGPLTAAAEQYDDAARELFGAAPIPTAAGHGLRAAGRLLLNAHVAKPSETKQLLLLLAQLAALSDAVARLRETQQRAAQAAAARAAAEQLRAVTHNYQRTVQLATAAATRTGPASTHPVAAAQAVSPRHQSRAGRRSP